MYFFHFSFAKRSGHVHTHDGGYLISPLLHPQNTYSHFEIGDFRPSGKKSDFDFDLHTTGKLQLHQCINGFRGRAVYVQ